MRAAETKEEELAARERKLAREAERQAKTTKRLEHHAQDLAERERALARLGQSLLARRDGEPMTEPAAPKPTPAEVHFSEGLEALKAASKAIRPAP